MIKETSNSGHTNTNYNNETSWTNNIYNTISSSFQSLKDTIFPPFVCPSSRFKHLPADILNILFKDLGPSLLMFASTCKTYQQILNIPELKIHQIRLEKYKKALELIKKSYGISKNEEEQNPVTENFIRALTSMFPNHALKMTDKILLEDYKCDALTWIAKAYSSFNPAQTLEVLFLALDSAHKIDDKGSLCKKHDKLIYIIKSLGHLNPAFIESNLNITSYQSASFRKKNPIERYRTIANVAKTLFPVNPENALKLIKETLEGLKTRIHYDVSIQELVKSLGYLLSALSLFDAESALTQFKSFKDCLQSGYNQVLYDHQEDYIFISIINEIVKQDPKKALLIAQSAFAERDPINLQDKLAYSKILKLCNENEKASAAIEQVLEFAQNCFDKIEIAHNLASFDPEKAIIVLNKVLLQVLSMNNDLNKSKNLKNIFALLTELNDKATVIEHVETAFSDVTKINKEFILDMYSTISTLAVALASFNLERALEMADTIKNPVIKASTLAKMANCIIQKTNEL